MSCELLKYCEGDITLNGLIDMINRTNDVTCIYNYHFIHTLCYNKKITLDILKYAIIHMRYRGLYITREYVLLQWICRRSYYISIEMLEFLAEHIGDFSGACILTSLCENEKVTIEMLEVCIKHGAKLSNKASFYVFDRNALTLDMIKLLSSNLNEHLLSRFFYEICGNPCITIEMIEYMISISDSFHPHILFNLSRNKNATPEMINLVIQNDNEGFKHHYKNLLCNKDLQGIVIDNIIKNTMDIVTILDVMKYSTIKQLRTLILYNTKSGYTGNAIILPTNHKNLLLQHGYIRTCDTFIICKHAFALMQLLRYCLCGPIIIEEIFEYILIYSSSLGENAHAFSVAFYATCQEYIE
jgi:hypothetical protein